MYKWDDILIVGDSWCAERENLGHWPNELLFELTDISKGTPRGKGFPGCHWWSVRKRLFQELNSKSAKVVIIIHTDASRIPSDTNRAFTIAGVMNQLRKKDDVILKAASEYYKHLYSANFHDWAERQWFRELDSFLEKKQVEKIIHLHGFNKHEEQKYTFKNGVTVEYSLHRYLTMNTGTVTYPNHMTYENNQKLALFLHKLITNYPGHGTLYKEKPFER